MFLRYSMGTSTARGGITSIDIIDDDFTTIMKCEEGRDENHGMAECLGYYTIKCYEERNLPVVSNLLKAFIYHGKTYHYDLRFIIWMNEQNNALYPKYKKEIERLLILI